MSAEAYVGLGANLGSPKSTFEKALNLISDHSKILSVSNLYQSSPSGFLDQPPFLNAAIHISTNLRPVNLILKLQQDEQKLGKKVIRDNGPRLIDLDLLLYDNKSIVTELLVLPHPRILERDFVLLPLMDLNPNLTHPDWEVKTLKSAIDNLQQRFVEKPAVNWKYFT